MSVERGHADIFPSDRRAFGIGRRLRRSALRRCMPGAANVLEIGPGSRPFVVGPNVKYLDILDSAGLAARADMLGDDPSSVPRIDYHCPLGDLTMIEEQFDFVISSHNFEHHPDLVRHIQGVERLLVEGGCYVLIVPDRRYCFDHYCQNSTLADILEAYHEKRKVHTLRSLIQLRALSTHNVAWRHWCGSHGGKRRDVESATKQAVQEWTASNGAYVDAHAWQFTPKSFAEVIASLAGLGYISMRAARVYSTPVGRLEFCAVLEKPFEAAVASEDEASGH